MIQAVGSSTFTQLNTETSYIYVGGVSPNVVATKILQPGEQVSTHAHHTLLKSSPDVLQSFPSVEACISSLSINNDVVDLNANINSSGIVACSDVLIDEVVTFTGNNSYAQLLESFSPIRDFQLKLSFRNTIQNKRDCSGLLVYIGSTVFSDHLTLNLDSGRVSISVCIIGR